MAGCVVRTEQLVRGSHRVLRARGRNPAARSQVAADGGFVPSEVRVACVCVCACVHVCGGLVPSQVREPCAWVCCMHIAVCACV
jgi:hypothetical protein